VPNNVLTRRNYEIVMDASRPISERRAAFANRAAWIAPLGNTSYTDQINNMIAHFDHLGVIEVVSGPTDSDAFPRTMEVEDRREAMQDVISERHEPNRLGAPAGVAAVHAGPRGTTREVDISQIDKVRRFPLGLPVKFR